MTYKTTHLFLTVLKAAKSNIKALVDLVSGEGLLPAELFLLCLHMVEDTGDLFRASFGGQ